MRSASTSARRPGRRRSTKAASGLKTIHDRDGGKALAGFGSAKGSNEEAYLFQKLIRQGFGTNNVDHCTRLCHASSVAALMEGLNSAAVTAPFTAAKDADCIIVIGARPAENHPVAATFLKNAAKRGAKMIVIDPRGQSQGISRYASHVLQFKPGRDVALLNAMLHTIVEEGLVDVQYVQARTDGFDALKAGVADFAPEKMAEVCGVPAATIREVARLYARSERSLIFWGMGISQHTHGTDNARCLIALALITGQIGRPGTGLHPLRGQNNVQGASDAGLIPMVFPDYQSVEDPAIRGSVRRALGPHARSQRGPHRGRDHARGPRRRDQGHVHHGREPGDVGPGRAACARGAGPPRAPRRAGHLPHRDRLARRRRSCRRPRTRRNGAPSPTPIARCRSGGPW